ncbi:unnamed protein product [Auanema sp. JU1783]|nr:unnamed protein product [Auanema sp. JU1783]
MQMSIYGALPGPLDVMYNATLVKHYGIYADEKGLSAVSSVMSILTKIGLVFSLVCITPLLDSKGRKFVSIHLRTVLGVTVAVCQICASQLDSAEFYFIAQFVVGMAAAIQINMNQLYLTECAPDSHRGFVSSALLLSTLSSSVVSFFLCNPNVLGTVERWYIVSIFTLVLCLALYFCTCRFPDSPKWLVSQGRLADARQSILYFHGKDVDVDYVLKSITSECELKSSHTMKIREVLKDVSLRAAMVLIIATQLQHLLSVSGVEMQFSVLVNTHLGLTAAQSLNLSLLSRFIIAPVRLIGTTCLDKIGRRPTFFILAILSLTKVGLMTFAHLLLVTSGPSVITISIVYINEFLSELVNATGFAVINVLLVSELIPPMARVSVMQFTLGLAFLLSIPQNCFPFIYATWPPLYFLMLMVLQPLLIFYIFNNLPETKDRSVCDIVNEFEQEIRTRGSTFLESTHLLPKSRAGSFYDH